MKSKSYKTRVDYLDYTRGLAILLIVLGHVTQYFKEMKYLTIYVNSFHVSTFFVISGLIFLCTDTRNLNFTEYTSKKFKNLIIPYIIFSLINSFLKLFVLEITHRLNNVAIKDEMKQLLITGNGTVWFLLTLFLIEVLFYFVSKLKKKNYKYLIAIIATIIPFIMGQAHNAVEVVLLRVLLGFGYYTFGYSCFKIIKDNIKIPLYAGVICIVLGAYLNSFGVELNYFEGQYKNIFISIPSSLLSICGIIIAFQNIKIKLKLFSYWGKNSLIIMLTHPIILLFFTYPLGKWFASINFTLGIVLTVVIFITIILLEFPTIEVINKFLPFINGKNNKKSE